MVQQRPNYDPLAAAATSYDVLSKAFADVGVDRAASGGRPAAGITSSQS
jgi:hypothetical protein